MQQPDKIIGYLEAVRRQIRWKKAQSLILEEIENHITDQKNAFLMEGLDEQTATDRAVAQMGDPIVVGEQLDRTHRPRPDWTLLMLTAAMLLAGIAIQYFISPAVINGVANFKHQIIWSGIAVFVMAAAYFTDFTIVGKYPVAIFAVLCAAAIASYLFTGRVNGRSANTVYLMLMFPAAFAGLVYGLRNKGYGGIILCGTAFIIPAYLSIVIPSVTVLFLLCVSCLVILTGAVLKGWFNVSKLYAMLIIYIPTAAALSVPFFMMKAEGYISRRMQIRLNPSLAPTGEGYIGTLIQRLMSHSQFIGQGSPINGYEGYQASQILPAANTDFLLTYLTYNFGWIMLMGMIAVFSVFIIRAVMLCKKQKSVLGFLMSLAIILTFAVQCIVYIASNLGFLLFSPLSLPLITYGGKALVINMGLIGLLLSVFRTGDLVRDRAVTAAKKPGRFIQYHNGRIIIDLKPSSVE